MPKRIFYFLMFACLWAATPAQAQLFLEQGKLVLPTTPGTRLNNTLTVHNTTDRNVAVKVYWDDFEYQPPFEGTKSFLPAGTSPLTTAKWVTFSPREFTLPPFSEKKVDYLISVPENSTGGHYGVLFFETSGERPAGDKGVTIATRVGCLFFLEPKDKSKSSQIDHVAVDGDQLVADFTNNGDVILTPESEYYVLDASGVAVDRGKITNMYLPPGQTAHFHIPLEKDIPSGTYTAVVNFDLQDGDVLVKEIDFTKDGGLTIQQVRD
jgi:P pilus assembly chaperone PapD